MSRWRKEAFDRLPECRKQLQEEKSPYGFFQELSEALYQAHLRQDEELLRRIYRYAQWCLQAPRGKDASDDLATIVTVSFFEHLPTHREVRKAVGRFLPKAFIEGMRDVFLYHGTEEKYQEILASCEVIRPKPKAHQSSEPAC
jgi:hypothetical protein